MGRGELFIMDSKTSTRKLLTLSTLLLILAACATATPYKAYMGEPRQDMQLSTVEGRSFRRTDIINRYTDTVRFMEVDGIPVQNSEQYRAIQISPGFHDIKVYFSWDLGSRRGLAPAMLDYARNRDNLSRTLRFNARAGESYTVMAKPVFSENKQDITTLAHVDFWVEDQQGIEIVSREDGRYTPSK